METDNGLDEINLKSEETLLASVEKMFDPVEKTFDIATEQTPPKLKSLMSNAEVKRKKIEENRSFDCNGHVVDDTAKVSALQLKCKELYAQLQSQANELTKAHEEIHDLRDQILNHTTFCASLGALLGNLAWRASTFPQIIDIWLSGFQNKIGEFLSIANGSFVAFIDTYETEFPPINNIEYNFIISLLSIVTNISASAQGRQFLLTNPSGKDFVQNIIKFMPNLPSSSASIYLKRLSLMLLYNVSINKIGLQYLFELRVSKVLNNYLEEDFVPDNLQLLCLRVLRSITYNLTEPKYASDVIKSISITKIEDIAVSGKSELSNVAKEVVKQLQDAKRYASLS